MPRLRRLRPSSRAGRRRGLAVLGLTLALTPLAFASLGATDETTDRAKAIVPLPPQPWLTTIPPRNEPQPHPYAELCEREGVTCPDLAMRAPYQLIPDVRGGRRVLRAANAVLSIGEGPVEVRGRRIGALTMRATQYVHRRGKRPLRVPGGAGQVVYKAIPGQGRIWKFQNAAKFELWSTGDEPRLVRTGPKLTYCLRDLRKLWNWKRSPRRQVYPACSGNSRLKEAKLGTSPGWADIYPAPYYEQWIDVHGLRGCFDLLHIADPQNHIIESDERNNAAKTRIRLPMGRKQVSRC